MRLLSTRAMPESDTHNAFDEDPTKPRKAYRIAGQVVCGTGHGREILVQWKSGDMWEQGTFNVPDETVYMFDEGESSHLSSTPPDLEQGDEVTIDYMPLGRQYQALVIRWGARKEFAPEAKDSAAMLQSMDETFFSSMVDAAMPRVAEKKACA